MTEKMQSLASLVQRSHLGLLPLHLTYEVSSSESYFVDDWSLVEMNKFPWSRELSGWQRLTASASTPHP